MGCVLLFPASETRRCAASIGGLRPCADWLSAVFRTPLGAWQGIGLGNWRVAGLGGQSKCSDSFPASWTGRCGSSSDGLRPCTDRIGTASCTPMGRLAGHTTEKENGDPKGPPFSLLAIVLGHVLQRKGHTLVDEVAAAELILLSQLVHPLQHFPIHSDGKLFLLVLLWNKLCHVLHLLTRAYPILYAEYRIEIQL